MLKKIMMPGLGVVALLYSAGAIAGDYIAIRTSAVANVDADTAWSRIGDYCRISDLLDVSCQYSEGAGELGTVRSLNDGAIIEPMVAQTENSYTYGQLEGSNAALDYHGTLSVEPAGPNQATIFYTLVYDQARLPDAAARAEKRRMMEERFQGAVANAKALAEGL